MLGQEPEPPPRRAPPPAELSGGTDPAPASRVAALAALVGLLAGLAAALLASAVRLCTRVLLGGLAGYHPATLASEGHVHAASGFTRPWLVPLVAAAGALAASLLVYRVAPETGGHGTDAAIGAAHDEPAGMRARVPLVKMIASTVTLGSGGSGGTEGPIAQIAAALASVLARRARVSRGQAQIVVMAGLAAGIGAIFRAPLAGPLLGAELLYVRGMALRVIGPALISCAAASGVYGALHGYGPLFGQVSADWPGGAAGLWTFAVLGLACGLGGRLYAASFYTVHAITVRLTARAARYRMPPYVPPAIGGLLVGLLGLAVPGVLGPGYGTAQVAMDPHWALRMSVWALLAIPVAKIVATSLSIGSGGSGGIFGPGLVIGAGIGCALWRLAEPHGLAGHSPAPYVIVGMAACLGPIIHAPLGVTVLVIEATLAPGMIGPTALATVTACLVVGHRTLYRSQLPGRSVASALRRPAAWRRTGPCQPAPARAPAYAVEDGHGRPLIDGQEGT